MLSPATPGSVGVRRAPLYAGTADDAGDDATAVAAKALASCTLDWAPARARELALELAADVWRAHTQSATCGGASRAGADPNRAGGRGNGGDGAVRPPAPSADDAGGVAPARTLVALAGAPGSGKSTVARCAQQLLNECARLDASEAAHADSFCQVIPMDGFHLYRAQLDALPNASEAHARRGAPFTFDAARFVRCVRALRAEPRREHRWPAFEHSVGDPVEEAIVVAPAHRIVLLEGNYVLLPESPWKEIATLVDRAVFLACDDEGQLLERLASRHQRALALTRREARRHAADNDLVNARRVNSNACRARADVVIGAGGSHARGTTVGAR